MGTPSQTAAREAILIESAPLLAGEATATFSEDRAYRYLLTRKWGTSGTHAVWIMLNPSTADALEDDPTIRRCVGFTRAWGLDGLLVVNLFALRATDPRELAGSTDPVGPLNDRYLSRSVHPWSVIVAAWGAHPAAEKRSREAVGLLGDLAEGLSCLGTTKDGWPRHPLYVPAAAELEGYEVPGA